jgi:hypothetical protein
MPGFADSFWSNDYAAGELRHQDLSKPNLATDRIRQGWVSCLASYSKVPSRTVKS